MPHVNRTDGRGRWMSALLAVLLATAWLAGCEDTEARKRADDQAIQLRLERDELARQLEKTRGELKAVQSVRDELRIQLRTAIAEANANRGDREQAAGQNRRLLGQIEWVNAQYNSLKEKNQVLDDRIAELDKLVAQWLAPSSPPTTQPTTQPDLPDLVPPGDPGAWPRPGDLPPSTAPDAPALP